MRKYTCSEVRMGASSVRVLLAVVTGKEVVNIPRDWVMVDGNVWFVVVLFNSILNSVLIVHY